MYLHAYIHGMKLLIQAQIATVILLGEKYKKNQKNMNVIIYPCTGPR